MATQTQLRMTPEEYLRAERQAETKSEFHDGEIFALAGASYSHNLVVANVIAELGVQLKGRSCAVLPSDLRLWIESASRHVYPDITVVCGEPQFTDGQQDTLINPTLLIEVLSKTTETYDRGEKLELYRTLTSVAEVVLLAQDRPYCEHYLRQPDAGDGWVCHVEQSREAIVELISIDCCLRLSEAFERVPFAGPRRM